MDIGAEVANITRVNLVVDSDHMYTAGDDTGRTLEVECPWGTQAMASSILASVGGVNYKPFSAERALLDPAFEVGDAVTIGGVYSQIAGADCTYNGASLFTIEAPELDEIDDEYPAQQTQQSSFKRQLAYTRSLITKTAEEIRLEVSGVDGKVSALSVALDGVTIQDENGQTLIKGSSIDTSTIKANSITVDKLQLTGSISWGDLATDAQSRVTAAATAADSANNKVSAWTYGGSTFIDGSKIMTGTVMASYLQGGIININGVNGSAYGVMYAGTNSEGTTAFELRGTYGLRLFSGGNVYMQSAYGSRVVLQSDGAYIGPTVYTTSGTLIASDRDLKHDVEYGLGAYDAVFDNLKPSRFKYNDGSSDRYHTALIAQDVKEAVLLAGLTTQDFAGYCEVPQYAKDENGNDTEEVTGYTCALRYDEFIALNIRQIQLLKARVAELEARL